MGAARKSARAFAFLLTLLLPVAPALGYEWTAREGEHDWRLHRGTRVRFTSEGALLSATARHADLVFSLPPGATPDISIGRMRLRTMSIDCLATSVLLSAGRVVASRELPIFSGRSWKDVVFNFNDQLPLPSFDSLGFVFRHCESVEIAALDLRGPSFSELLLPQGFQAPNVNMLRPFRLWGWSANVWCYAALALAGLTATAISPRRRKQALLLGAAIALACAYLALDAREILEEIRIIRLTQDDYLRAAPGKKRFHWHDNLVEFASLIRREVEAPQGPIHFAGHQDRYLYMRYLLYPLKLAATERELGDVNIFSEVDNVLLDGNKLLLNGKVLLEGGMGIPYSPHSFVYVAR